MSQGSSRTSDAVAKFLKGRVKSHQGISLEELTGHFSELSPELRTKYGSSASTLMAFLERYPKVFTIRNGTNVYVATNDSRGTPSLHGSSANVVASASNRNKKEENVTSLNGVTGTVYRLFTIYGFISVEAPVSTRIYFDVHSFENARHPTLPSSGLQVGDSVIFDAKIGPKDSKVKFRATRVTRVIPTKPSSSPGHSLQNACGDEEVVDYSSSSRIVNQYGVVELVKSRYGYLKFGPDESERAIFNVNDVDKSLRGSIRNLSDVFSVNNKVRFDAQLRTKPSEKVKWKATAVYLFRDSDCSGASPSEEFDGNEIFMSDDETGSQDILDETPGESVQ